MKMGKSKISIYSCTHIHKVIVTNRFIIPLQLRKKITGIDLGYLSDDMGDNISNKGLLYGGSAPAFYWVWKNDKQSDYVGFCHYRRYFLIDEKHTYYQTEYVTTKDGLEKLSFDDTYLRKVLSKYDVVLSKKRRFTSSVWDLYSRMHDERDLLVLENIIKELCPEYLPLIDKYLKHGNRLHQYSMMIMRKHDFDEFCEWLFPIVFKLDENKNEKSNSLCKPRQIDYLLEHLMPLYFLKHKELLIKELPIVVADASKKRVSNIRYFCSQIKTQIKYMLNL